MGEKPKLLIVEDDLGLCGQYRWAFPQCDLIFAHNREQSLIMAERERPSVIIMDLGLPPDPDGVSEGFALLDGLVQLNRDLKIVVATSHDDRAHAVRAIGAGAYDFCEKPVDIELLTIIIQRSIRLTELEVENRRLTAISSNSAVRNIITADEGMLKVCRDIERLANNNVPILLLGESGTGKEALARALHELGPRAKQQFVAINCGAIPENLLESELFGYERGAFTGAVKQTPGRIELAHRGTLFLDEIGDLPHSLQVKLLRFLQDQVVERIGGRAPIQVNVRVVSATNQLLQESVNDQRFRADLFYRLNAITVRIPPLRARGSDATLLARFFVAKFNQEYGRSVRGFTDDALAALGSHPWPGNIRELENRLKRAVLMSDNRLLTADDLELQQSAEDMSSYNLRDARARAERQVIQRALARGDGRLSAAARLLGVSRPTLYTLLEAHGLSATGGSEPNLSAESPAN